MNERDNIKVPLVHHGPDEFTARLALLDSAIRGREADSSIPIVLCATELFYARMVNVYNTLPLRVSLERDKPILDGLEYNFCLSQWRPEDTLFGVLTAYWDLMFEWMALPRPKAFASDLNSDGAGKLEAICRTAVDDTANWYMFRPWFASHADKPLSLQLEDHPVGQWRKAIEAVYKWLYEWSRSPYETEVLMGKALELLDLMGNIMVLIGRTHKRRMVELESRVDPFYRSGHRGRRSLVAPQQFDFAARWQFLTEEGSEWFVSKVEKGRLVLDEKLVHWIKLLYHGATDPATLRGCWDSWQNEYIMRNGNKGTDWRPIFVGWTERTQRRLTDLIARQFEAHEGPLRARRFKDLYTWRDLFANTPFDPFALSWVAAGGIEPLWSLVREQFYGQFGFCKPSAPSNAQA